MNWFQVKVKYAKISEQGIERMVTEQYLVDAMTFTEAEARTCKEMEEVLGGEFAIVDIKRTNFKDLFPFDGEQKWYNCKVVFLALDEEKGTTKKTKIQMLVQASSVDGAVDNLKLGMKDMSIDWESVSVSETAIVDIFPYYAEE
jgi:hypothetical protein